MPSEVSPKIRDVIHIAMRDDLMAALPQWASARQIKEKVASKKAIAAFERRWKNERADWIQRLEGLNNLFDSELQEAISLLERAEKMTTVARDFEQQENRRRPQMPAVFSFGMFKSEYAASTINVDSLKFFEKLLDTIRVWAEKARVRTEAHNAELAQIHYDANVFGQPNHELLFDIPQPQDSLVPQNNQQWEEAVLVNEHAVAQPIQQLNQRKVETTHFKSKLVFFLLSLLIFSGIYGYTQRYENEHEHSDFNQQDTTLDDENPKAENIDQIAEQSTDFARQVAVLNAKLENSYAEKDAQLAEQRLEFAQQIAALNAKLQILQAEKPGQILIVGEDFYSQDQELKTLQALEQNQPDESVQQSTENQLYQRKLREQIDAAMVTTLSLGSDKFPINYSHEWPRTLEDYQELFEMSHPILEKIETRLELVNRQQTTVGIWLYYKGQADPVKFGCEGVDSVLAVFNEKQTIKTIKVKGQENDKDGAFRGVYFLDATGKQLVHRQDGRKSNSFIKILKSSMPFFFPGKEVTIPEGHEIIGFAAQANSQGIITWIDLKVWKPPQKK